MHELKRPFSSGRNFSRKIFNHHSIQDNIVRYHFRVHDSDLKRFFGNGDYSIGRSFGACTRSCRIISVLQHLCANSGSSSKSRIVSVSVKRMLASFAVSITLPPPTAIIKSALSSLHLSTSSCACPLCWLSGRSSKTGASDIVQEAFAALNPAAGASYSFIREYNRTFTLFCFNISGKTFMLFSPAYTCEVPEVYIDSSISLL